MAYKWQKNYSSTDWVYVNETDNSARYVLGVKGQNPLIVFGINPSTASDKEPDATLIRVEKMADCKKYDSWIMLNLYPFRSTKIEDLKTFDHNLHKENLIQIEKILDQYPSASILAAWGNIDSKLNSSVKTHIKNCLTDITNLIQQKKREWLALLDVGYPVHFLYKEKDFKLYNVNFVKYIPNV